jgi:hypothetical protein
MPYEINTGPLPAGLQPRNKPRGARPAYPLREMAIGQWITVPLAEERKISRAVENARYNHGLYFQVRQSPDGASWIVLRCSPAVDTR